MTETLYHYVNGAAMSGSSGRFVDVCNPAVSEVRAPLPFAMPTMDKQ